jgi:hypothetical protein
LGLELLVVDSSFSMDSSMAMRAERDQIIHGVASELAPRLDMMNLKIFCASTGLATPTVTFKDFSS